jgi:hypothetical protein
VAAFGVFVFETYIFLFLPLISYDMHNRITLLVFVFGLFLFTSSCDDCMGPLGKAKVECSNGGTCNYGVCDCLKGYTGPSCQDIDICELKDVFCDKGACVLGVCECDPGYEGEDCSVSSRVKYFGRYLMTERCEKLDTITSEVLEIETNPLEPSQMYIINLCSYNNFELNGFFSKVYAVPNVNTNTFTIPYQKPDGENTDKIIEGTGEIVFVNESTTTISITYTLTVGTKVYNCTVEATKLPE